MLLWWFTCKIPVCLPNIQPQSCSTKGIIPGPTWSSRIQPHEAPTWWAAVSHRARLELQYQMHCRQPSTPEPEDVWGLGLKVQGILICHHVKQEIKESKESVSILVKHILKWSLQAIPWVARHREYVIPVTTTFFVVLTPESSHLTAVVDFESSHLSIDWWFQGVSWAILTKLVDVSCQYLRPQRTKVLSNWARSQWGIFGNILQHVTSTTYVQVGVPTKSLCHTRHSTEEIDAVQVLRRSELF